MSAIKTAFLCPPVTASSYLLFAKENALPFLIKNLLADLIRLQVIKCEEECAFNEKVSRELIKII